MRNLQNVAVELHIALKIGCGDNDIPVGSSGRVEWDEGGEKVIVQFDHEIHRDSYGLSKGQVWVPRTHLTIRERSGDGTCALPD